MYYNNVLPEELNYILDYITDGILLVNDNSEIIFYNKALLKLYNFTTLEMNLKTTNDLLENHDMKPSFLELTMDTKKQVIYEQTLKNKKNIITTLTPILSSTDNLKFVVAHCRAVEDLKFYSPKSSLFKKSKSSTKSNINSHNNIDNNIILAEFKSPAMQNIYRLADNMASKNINILILGSSGIGKTQLAYRIHRNSPRKEGPFVTINCSTIPENLIESELFGYVKGAFSGALNTGKKGLVEVANGGTLFLDEIGELPFSLQSKLLQLVQDKTYLPIGGIQSKQVDTRIVAATNKDILSLISQGMFREDLYYRLAVVTILIPPLAGRQEDILLLIRHFSNVFNLKHETNISFSKDTIELLTAYSWPGNIRELEHLIEFLILNSEEKYVTPSMLPISVTQNENEILKEDITIEKAEPVKISEDLSEIKSLEKYLEKQEKKLIKALYPQYNTSYKLASKLQISQSKASRLIRKYIKN